MRLHDAEIHVEQATSGPGEVRGVVIPIAKRCWKSVADDTMNRCQLRLGHAGDCEGRDGGE